MLFPKPVGNILPFGPVALIFYWPKKIISGQPKASPHFRHWIGNDFNNNSELQITIRKKIDVVPCPKRGDVTHALSEARW